MSKKLLGEIELNRIYQRDCIEGMRMIPNDSVDLIVIDPPYNIGKDKRWDKWKTVDAYIEFMATVFMESQRILKSNGSFYWWHNDIKQVRKLMDVIDDTTPFIFRQFITWDKYNGSKWNQLNAIVHAEANRNFPKQAEYCLFYTFDDETGMNAIYSDTNLFSNLRAYIKFEASKAFQRNSDMNTLLGFSKSGGMATRKYLGKSQWQLPTKEHYEKLQTTGFFQRSYADIREEYETLKKRVRIYKREIRRTTIHI